MGELSTGEEAWASHALGRERSHTDPGADKMDMKDTGEGGKIWKLMKRISTGGLRERFLDKETAVPPVPAIPKELLDRANCTGPPSQTADVATRKPRPFPPSRRRSSSLEKQSGARPSMTTSSSPNSSDVASAQFFQRPYSPRSSISSYGELKHPIRHIIPPSEQLRLADDIQSEGDETPKSPRRRSTSLPPRSRNNPDSDLPLHSPPSAGSNGSSTTPMSGHILLAEGGVALSPPPPRNSRGNSRTSNGSVPNFSSQSALKPIEDCDSDVANTHPLIPQRGSLDHHQVRTQLTFRQLDVPRRPPLTEREKADIWDDLLARSDRAGGTLHIGAMTRVPVSLHERATTLFSTTGQMSCIVITSMLSL
ncbi:hypothetical protein J3A83DRAFT_356604 [Scleroderma citrinum]